MTTVTFTYLNHRGVTSRRTVDLDAVEFQKNPGFGYQPGWFISGRCHDKNARRSFALSRITIDDAEWRSHGNAIYKLSVI